MAAIALTLVGTIAMSFAIAAIGVPRGGPSFLMLILPPMVAGLLLFRGMTRLVAVAGLALLVIPGAMAAEMIAHLLGTCLYD